MPIHRLCVAAEACSARFSARCKSTEPSHARAPQCARMCPNVPLRSIPLKTIKTNPNPAILSHPTPKFGESFKYYQIEAPNPRFAQRESEGSNPRPPHHRHSPSSIFHSPPLGDLGVLAILARCFPITPPENKPTAAYIPPPDMSCVAASGSWPLPSCCRCCCSIFPRTPAAIALTTAGWIRPRSCLRNWPLVEGFSS